MESAQVKTSILKKAAPHTFAVLLTVACAFTAPWEGETHTAIIPVKGDVPTICDGETHGVYLGMTATHEQCVEMLKTELAPILRQLDVVATVPLTDAQKIIFADFIYNEGMGNFEHGSHDRPAILPSINGGHVPQACEDLMKYDVMVRGCHKVAGKEQCNKRELRGLFNRRAAERRLCLQ